MYNTLSGQRRPETLAELTSLAASLETLSVELDPVQGVVRIFADQSPDPTEWEQAMWTVEKWCSDTMGNYGPMGEIDVFEFRIAPGVEIPGAPGPGAPPLIG
jgi:hypothetical protein